MKFRFCGDADCPDWLLMQINTLSKLDPARLEEFCRLVVQPLVGKEMDYQKILEFSKAVSLELGEVKAWTSAVSQVVEMGCCHGVSPSDLCRELEQLGLDRTHSQAIGRVYSEEREAVTDKLREGVLRAGRMEDLSASPQGGAAAACLSFRHTDLAGKTSQHNVRITEQQLRLLLADLKGVKKRMEELHQE